MQRSVLILMVLTILLGACGTDDTSTRQPTPAARASTAAEAPTHTPVPTRTPLPENMHRFIIVAEDSQVSYSVEEIFISHNNKHVTAVGTTHDVSGEAFYDPDNPQNSTLGAFTVDISTFQSDSNNRDRAIRERWLESTKYPIARFEPTSIEGLPESYTEGEEMTLLITGDLTVHDTTRSVTFETTGFIEDNTMVGTATTTIQMSDFGFEPPRLAGIVETKDSAHIRFDFVAQAE